MINKAIFFLVAVGYAFAYLGVEGRDHRENNPKCRIAVPPVAGEHDVFQLLARAPEYPPVSPHFPAAPRRSHVLPRPPPAPELSPFSPSPLPAAPRRSPFNSRLPPAPKASPVSPPLPSLPGMRTKVFNLLDYGASGNGKANDTEALRGAWADACQFTGVGRAVVIVPRHYTFLIHPSVFLGPCQSNLTLQVDGTIMAPGEIDSWPANNHRNWLVFYGVSNLTLSGRGLIDGQGRQWWNLPCKPRKGTHGGGQLSGQCDSPVAMRFFLSSNVMVRGVRFKNSPQFHLRFDSCRWVTVHGISVSSPALSPNTDGIHIENTANVHIRGSVISNGDDCISIGSGSLNVAIENVTCGQGHGISIGSLGRMSSRACVANVTVRNAAIVDSDNGVRIKTWQGGSGSVSAVAFENVRVRNVRNPIIIDQYYCISGDCGNETSAVVLSGITYSGIRGTYDDKRGPPVHLGCSDAVPCTNITFADINLRPAHGSGRGDKDDPFCWNAYGTAVTPTVPPVLCLLNGLPSMITDVDVDRCY